jgi:hypothetical protein
MGLKFISFEYGVTDIRSGKKMVEVLKKILALSGGQPT